MDVAVKEKMHPRHSRIELRIDRERDSEVTCTLDNPDDQNVLPGALCDLVDDQPPYVVSPIARDIFSFDPVVLIENAHLGSALSAKQYDQDRVLCRRLLTGDIYLLRATPGKYEQGDPLYATQRDNGVYVSKRGEGRFIGWSKETVIISEEDMDPVDDRINNPDPEAINLKKLNLIRVKAGRRPMSALNPNAPKNYTWTATTLSTYWAGEIKDTIAKATTNESLDISVVFSHPLPELRDSEVSVGVVSFVPKCQVFDSENMVFVDPDPPVVSISDITRVGGVDVVSFEIGGFIEGTLVLSFSLKKEDALTGTVYFKTVLSSLGSPSLLSEPTTGPVVGYWGVCYPDLLGMLTPTEEEILSLTGVTRIYGKSRPMSVSFRVNEEDWTACGGGEFNNLSMGRAFFISEWGRSITSIKKGDSIMWQEFRPFHIKINEKDYHGYISAYPIAYDGVPYSFYVGGVG